MSCDIHLYTEKKVKLIDGDEVWICCDYFTLNPYWYHYHNINLDDNKIISVFEHNSIYINQDYELFGRLAGVRDESVPLLDAPRGLPDNISNFVQSEAMQYESDGHSYSWFTAAELFKYDKKHKSKSFHRFVKLVKKKMKKEFNIWSFYSKSEKKHLIKEYANDFRIIFWFDN